MWSRLNARKYLQEVINEILAMSRFQFRFLFRFFLDLLENLTLLYKTLVRKTCNFILHRVKFVSKIYTYININPVVYVYLNQQAKIKFTSPIWRTRYCFVPISKLCASTPSTMLFRKNPISIFASWVPCWSSQLAFNLVFISHFISKRNNASRPSSREAFTGK